MNRKFNIGDVIIDSGNIVGTITDIVHLPQHNKGYYVAKSEAFNREIKVLCSIADKQWTLSMSQDLTVPDDIREKLEKEDDKECVAHTWVTTTMFQFDMTYCSKCGVERN